MAFSALTGAIDSAKVNEYRVACNQRLQALGKTQIPSPSGGRNQSYANLLSAFESIRWKIENELIGTGKDVFLDASLGTYGSLSALLTAAGHGGGWVSMTDLPIEDPSPLEQLQDVFAIIKKYRRSVLPILGSREPNDQSSCRFESLSSPNPWNTAVDAYHCTLDKAVASDCTGSCEGESVSGSVFEAFGETMLWRDEYKIGPGGDATVGTGFTARRPVYTLLLAMSFKHDLSSLLGSFIKINIRASGDGGSTDIVPAGWPTGNKPDVEYGLVANVTTVYTDGVLSDGETIDDVIEVTSGVTLDNDQTFILIVSNPTDLDVLLAGSDADILHGIGAINESGSEEIVLQAMKLTITGASENGTVSNVWADISSALTYG